MTGVRRELHPPPNSMEPWNDSAFTEPPVIDCYATRTFDKQQYQASMQVLLDRMKDEDEKAGAYISRIIASRTHSMRMQPAFHWLRKLNVALVRYRNSGIAETIKNTFDITPSHQYTDFLVVKIMGVAKLLQRIVQCAEETYHSFIAITRIGHMVEIFTLVMRAISRPWSWANRVLKEITAVQQMMAKLVACPQIESTELSISHQPIKKVIKKHPFALTDIGTRVKRKKNSINQF